MLFVFVMKDNLPHISLLQPGPDSNLGSVFRRINLYPVGDTLVLLVLLTFLCWIRLDSDLCGYQSLSGKLMFFLHYFVENVKSPAMSAVS